MRVMVRVKGGSKRGDEYRKEYSSSRCNINKVSGRGICCISHFGPKSNNRKVAGRV